MTIGKNVGSLPAPRRDFFPARVEATTLPDGTPGFNAYDLDGNLRAQGRTVVEIIAAHYGQLEAWRAWQAENVENTAPLFVRETRINFRVSLNLCVLAPSASPREDGTRFVGVTSRETRGEADAVLIAIQPFVLDVSTGRALSEQWDFSRWARFAGKLGVAVDEGRPYESVFAERPVTRPTPTDKQKRTIGRIGRNEGINGTR